MEKPLPVAKTPWNSIAESIVPENSATRNFQEALQSPCLSCATSPCCTHLPLNTFLVRNLIELDHARYLLNFDRIELGISADGSWSSYYTYPCRFLDRNSFHCTIHDQQEQPNICKNYNPYNCWYKRVFSKSISPDFIRIDRKRMEWILPQLEFGEDGVLTGIPAWKDLMTGIAAIPLDIEKPFSDYDETDFINRDWGDFTNDIPEEKNSSSLISGSPENPCKACKAYCCRTLFFPQQEPANYSNLDYFKFCLGFPGVEIGISDQSWFLIIKTTCRHLNDNQCSIFGKPERPLICKYYDEWKCNYKPQMGLLRPEGFLRVSLRHFQWLQDCFQFNELGDITAFPSTEELQKRLSEMNALARSG